VRYICRRLCWCFVVHRLIANSPSLPKAPYPLLKPRSRFDAAEFPTNFAAQIRDFDNEDLIDKKNARRYDDCLSYTMVASKKALRSAGIEKEGNPEGYAALDKSRVGVLVGSGMGGLTVFQDGVKALVEKGYKKITPFFIPYAITNMGGALVAIDQGFMGPNYSVSTACATANYAFVMGE
jgi:3-oxoacyl-[acyl-carrier-protein] synthase II